MSYNNKVGKPMSDTPKQQQQEQSDAQIEEGYYYDRYGNVARISVNEGQVECVNIGTEIDEPYHTFSIDEDPADYGYSKVADIAVENPIQVAREVYKHGYTRDGGIYVAEQRCGIEEFEFIDTVTEISLRDEFDHLGSNE